MRRYQNISKLSMFQLYLVKFTGKSIKFWPKCGNFAQRWPYWPTNFKIVSVTLYENFEFGTVQKCANLADHVENNQNTAKQIFGQSPCKNRFRHSLERAFQVILSYFSSPRC